MTCPFAKFASMFPASAHKHAALHPPTTGKVTLTLSDALRVGTAASHRAVEKSRGVSLLLQSHPTASSSALDEGLTFERLDYVRFNIMLACIYAALEASMYTARSSIALKALFDDTGLVAALVRSRGLEEDIAAHLDVIHSHTGAALADLAEHARDTEDDTDPHARAELLHLYTASLPLAARLAPTWSPTGLTHDHIALLTPAQLTATLLYARRLSALASDGDRLLAHAYTRYLGDLSGGQHILRKVSRRFPHPSAGFAFYAFDDKDLKRRFRDALEHAPLAGVESVVHEANAAFGLNTQLFESLLPPELRMEQLEEEGDVGKAQGAVVDTWPDQVVAVASALVVAVSTAVWIRHLLAGSAPVGDVYA
ncbi:related to Heme oxygenase [Sporisorium reilianum SRZ2]|uniref:Related to Heme oxygenase n=1 Tax=Sporisorium reilianum (strain SRZ2) TaxID=999809 RepID=E6ZLK5_SPORE|nr:related to Heme oxygenase [Sporisorium reilianum SRZ2]